MRCFLCDTDHLNDRQLYEWLWSTGLRGETAADHSAMLETAWHTSPIGACNDQDRTIWLRYYADEEERQRWHLGFPNDPMPAMNLGRSIAIAIYRTAHLSREATAASQNTSLATSRPSTDWRQKRAPRGKSHLRRQQFARHFGKDIGRCSA